jgi:DUF1680 family protein
VPSGACIGDESVKERSPDPSLPYEYCAITELMTSLQSAVQKTGAARYADMIDGLVLNAAQGARFPDGMAISYLTMDNRRSATAEQGHGRRQKYSPTHEDVAVCCNPSAVKLLPYYVNRMWMHTNVDSGGLAVLFYGPCSVTVQIDGVRVAIEQITDYPFSEQVVLRVMPEQDVAFPLRLRVPGWSQEMAVDAGDADVVRDGDYLVVNKVWRRGEEVTVNFSVDIRLEYAVNGEGFVTRGPLLYVLRIPEKQTPTKAYQLSGFHDYDCVPAETGPWERELHLQAVGKSAGFAVHHNLDADMEYPWESESTPTQLQGDLLDPSGAPVPVSLVPIGSTVLRQVTFPLWHS